MTSRLLARAAPRAVALLLLAGSTFCGAQGTSPAADLIGRAMPLALAASDLPAIESLLAETARRRAELSASVSRDRAAREAAAAELTALGPPAEDTSVEAEQRRQLAAELDRLDRVLAEQTLGLEQLEELTATLQRAARQAAGRRLLAAGESLPEVLYENLAEPGLWVQFAGNVTFEGTGYDLLDAASMALGLLVMLLCVQLGRVVRRALRAAAERLDLATFTGALLAAGCCSLAVHAPYALALGTLAGFVTYLRRGQEHVPFVVTLSYAALAWVFVRTCLRLALAPYPPARSLLDYERPLQLRLARGLSVLCVLILVYGLIGRIAREFGLAEAGLHLLRFVFVAALTADAAVLVWLERRLTARRHASRAAALALLAAALLAELLGYRGLADYLQGGVILSLLLALVFWAARRVLGELFDRLDDGRYRWTARLRATLAVPDGTAFPGLGSLRLAAWLSLHAAGALALLRIWALQAGYTAVVTWLNDGFTLADQTVIPARLFWGVILFALLLTLRALVRAVLARSLERASRLDRGARDAMVAVVDYGFFAIAALSALHVVGPELARNLAVVAGALSVGIGFGLQNIVNNFVSGLILLFERRIQVGDQIAVGDTSGTVRRLSVRATEIVTADQSEVAVPNSDLITRQVTNRTRQVPSSGLNLRVRVGHGGDPKEVARLLAEVALAHPEVQRRDGSPEVLLCELGETGPEFELRCQLAAAGRAAHVRSELLFAIDAALRDHGVAPPWPRHMVHLSGDQHGD